MSNQYIIRRLNDSKPLICQDDFERLGVAEEGDNINGPTLVCLPEWLRKRLSDTPLEAARYFLYFSHHKGAYIRMAWSETIEGPYHLYQTGTAVPEGRRGVLDIGPEREIRFDNGLRFFGHVASPRILFDHERERVILFFHAATDDHDKFSESNICQRTFVAFSANGLDFNGDVQSYILALPYFDPFFMDGQLFGIAGMGMFCEPRNPEAPFAPPLDMKPYEELWIRTNSDNWDHPFQRQIERLKSEGKLPEHLFRPRHYCVRQKNDRLECYYSRVGDAPERIVMSILEPYEDNKKNLRPLVEWEPKASAQDVLRPEESWEGVDFPIAPSEGGKCSGSVCQLRDPFVFEDNNGRSYLLYTGQGEAAIGLAEMRRL